VNLFNREKLQALQERTTKVKNIMNKWLLFLLGLLLLGNSAQAVESVNLGESTISEPSMDAEKKLPPIDMTAASEFETASFGLG
jgi:hypothetical protein